MKEVVAAFNREKYQVGAFSVIVKSTRTFVSSSTARTLLRGDTIAAVSWVTISRAIIYLDAKHLYVLVGMSVCPSFKVTEIFIIFKYR